MEKLADFLPTFLDGPMQLGASLPDSKMLARLIAYVALIAIEK